MRNINKFLADFKKELKNDPDCRLDTKYRTKHVILSAKKIFSKYFNEETDHYYGGGKKNGDYPEFLCDYTCQSKNNKILVCMESEWGKSKSGEGTKKAVIYDFRKILHVDAHIKIMIFAYTSKKNNNGNDNKEDILEEIKSTLSKFLKDTTSKSESFNTSTIIVIYFPWRYEEDGASYLTLKNMGASQLIVSGKSIKRNEIQIK